LKIIRDRLTRLGSDHKRIARGAMRVAFFLLLGKFVGAFKEMAVAYRYGISDVVDAYQFTLTMAGWLPVTAIGVLSVVLIPVLVKLKRQSQQTRERFLQELFGVTLAVGALLAVGLYFAWPWVLEWVGADLTANTRAMSQELMLAFAPVALLTLVAGVSSARLRAHERHINTLLDSIPALLILVWVMLAATAADVGPLLWGTLVGYMIQSAWLLWLASRADNVGATPRLGFQSPYWPQLVAAAGIMLVGQVAMSVVGPLDQYTAAELGRNANATLGYANRILALLLGLGAVSVGRAALPVLSDIHSRGDAVQGRRMALKWSVLMLGMGMAGALVGWLLAPWGVSLLFERGAFTEQDTLRVAGVFRWGLLQMPFYFGVLVLVQLLASQNRYRIMAVIALGNFALKALLNPILGSAMGLQGVMLATACMYALSYGCYVLAALKSVANEAPSGPAQ